MTSVVAPAEGPAFAQEEERELEREGRDGREGRGGVAQLRRRRRAGATGG